MGSSLRSVAQTAFRAGHGGERTTRRETPLPLRHAISQELRELSAAASASRSASSKIDWPGHQCRHGELRYFAPGAGFLTGFLLATTERPVALAAEDRRVTVTGRSDVSSPEPAEPPQVRGISVGFS